MNVVNMSRIFNHIPNLMIPITSIPETAHTLDLTAGTNMLDLYQPQGKPGFDEQPTLSRQINREEDAPPTAPARRECICLSISCDVLGFISFSPTLRAF
ncbi:hypothetical protein [Candidatus Nitrotoga sp. M5]|uniref:hypothetical protein n=1 Tax=Candidatus Nitrotoga sp. M5 TaxID=2890409 RepID=UPI001EF48735|nr:hypothetical protein [Candidatus Nitrotoga sp. M5]